MNWDTFNIFGYASVLLWVAVPLLCLVYWKRPRRGLCRTALVLAGLAFILAKINSVNHVDRIQLDRSEQMAEWEARQQAAREAAAASRGEEVAQIRFAEDASDEFMDKAGMDEADLKYMENPTQSSEPEWKKAKKVRGEGGTEDDDLEAMLGGAEAVEGMASDSLEEAADGEPVLMSESGMAMAHRLDGLNLNLIRLMVLLAVGMVVFDYLGRANRYAAASLPLALPSGWLNAVTPMPPVVVRPAPARRSMPEELAWLVKRGDSFVYLTDDPSAAAGVPASLPRFGKKWRPVDVLHVAGEGDDISDEFAFEALWYGRSCFVADSAARAERMMTRFIELLEERKKVRARVVRTVHVVWDLKAPLAEPVASEFARLAKAAGFSLFVCSAPSTEPVKSN